MSELNEDLQMFSQTAPPTEKQIKALKAVNRAAMAKEKSKPKAAVLLKKQPELIKKATTKKRGRPPKSNNNNNNNTKPPATTKKTDDSLQTKDKIVRKLQRYMEEFGQTKLKDLDFKLPTCQDSIEVIKEAELIIERRLGEQDATEFVVLAHVGVCQTIDRFNPLGFKVPGMLTRTAIQADNMQKMMPLLKEISIKYGHWLNRSVEFRYMAAMFQMCMAVKRADSLRQDDVPVSKEEEEKYDDL